MSSIDANTPQALDPRDSESISSAPVPPSKREDDTTLADDAEGGGQPKPKDFRFWSIIASLLLATFLSALDLTAIATALPTIASALDSHDFTWIGNAYSIGSAAFIPWSGGLAHVFGRRPVLLVGLALFAIGSAMCGSAKSMDLMLVGRTFQGVGSGFILSLSEIVLADLVSLSERGSFQGVFGAIWALASATGPVIGGALAGSNWRWLFYMNLPMTAGVCAIVAVFLDLKTPSGTYAEKMKKMDWLGNAVFIPSITLFIIGLVWGGQQYAWSDAHVVAPLVLGAVGLVLWFFVEKYWVEHPTVPFDVLINHTSAIGYFTTFLHGINALGVFYYWPAFFQAVFGTSSVKSAIDFFSVAFIVAPFAMVAGGSISATQIYYPQNVIAWVLMTLGPGLMSLVKYNSPKHAWVPLPIPFSIGIGLLYAATVFPVLAPLPPALAGHALAFLVFVRSFGNILGITVGSTTLANELAKRLPAEFIAQIPGGVSGAYSSIPYVKDLPEPLRTEVRKAFAESIRVIWLVLIPFGGIGLLAAVFMKHHKLETVTDEAWGIKHPSRDADDLKEANESQ